MTNADGFFGAVNLHSPHPTPPPRPHHLTCLGTCLVDQNGNVWVLLPDLLQHSWVIACQVHDTPVLLRLRLRLCVAASAGAGAGALSPCPAVLLPAGAELPVAQALDVREVVLHMEVACAAP